MQECTKAKNSDPNAQDNSRQYWEAVLASNAPKRIVVAGPGTGKTHLFRKVLLGKKKCITLTFINSLVDDLSLELCGLSEVKTLHSYALNLLSKWEAKIFPKLPQVIRMDALILLGQEIDFERLFNNREDRSSDQMANIEFYKRRKGLYGKFYGYSDVILGAAKYLESAKDKIPEYDLVLVDEFQDFNKLEISLIDLLAEKSPVLLTGDDDQALYDDKSASVEHIRERWNNKNGNYAAFPLPYCFRCTRVMVEAFNDIVSAAKSKGLLIGRIEREFKYAEGANGNLRSSENPKIIYSQKFVPQIPWFIESQIKNIAENVRDKFSVLVISPYKKQARKIAETLIAKGFENVDCSISQEGDTPTVLDGLILLADNEQCNLGWRIMAKFILNDEEFRELIRASDAGACQKLVDIIDVHKRREVEEILKIFRHIRDDRKPDNVKLDILIKILGADPNEIVRHAIRANISRKRKRLDNPGIGKIPIKVTTVQSSKGLSADFVFITHFDDKYFIKSRDGQVSDRDLRRFLVAFTRARNRVFLISSDAKGRPTLLDWIAENKVLVVQ